MICPYLVKHEDGYYICKASSELIRKDGIDGRICLSEKFKKCFEYNAKKWQEKIKDAHAFK
jgi:hypothetical protein